MDTLAERPNLTAQVAAAVTADAGEVRRLADELGDRLTPTVPIDFAGVDLADVRAARSRIDAELADVAFGVAADIAPARARVAELLADLAPFQGTQTLDVEARAAVAGDVVELRQLAGTLRELAARPGVTVEVAAQVRADAELIAQTAAELSERLTPSTAVAFEPEVDVRPKVTGGLLAPFQKLIDAGREKLREVEAVSFDLQLFGADAQDAAALRIKRQADELRERLRELGTLTPELEEQIAEKTQIELSRAFEAVVDAQIDVSSRGTFDGLTASFQLGTPNAAEERTATASELAAEASRQTAANTQRLLDRAATAAAEGKTLAFR